jgi:S-adenosylmethionine hydrolase
MFLSDFGLDDEFVGICHGVIATIAPEARVIDVTHGVPPQDVRRGAILLDRAVSFMPADSVFLAVVDPDVGGNRRAIAVGTKAGAILVGPNNGLLSLAWRSLGGVIAAHAIEAEEYRLHPTSATFHARDIFSPAAAHVADGLPIESLGPALPFSSLEAVTIPAASAVEGELRTCVLGIDRFGNVELSATATDLRRAGLQGVSALALEAGAGPAPPVLLVRTFADVHPGQPAVMIDSSGRLTIAVNRGRADERFCLELDDPVILRRS